MVSTILLNSKFSIFNSFRSHYGSEKQKNLIYLVKTKSSFPLFKFAHKTQSYP